MTSNDWLIDETRGLSQDAAWEEARAVLGFEEAAARAPIAAVLRDATIHDVRTLFGRADIRLDALFVTAASADEIYQPRTFTFPGVRDRDRLPIDEGGMLLYYGSPRYFIDVALIASQGGEGQKTLGELMAEQASAVGDLLGQVTGLAGVAAPPAAVITGAAAAAAKVAGLALHLLNEITGKSIGLYRVTWFENRDRFGLGVHPRDGSRFRKRDFEFRYEIFEDTAPSP